MRAVITASTTANQWISRCADNVSTLWFCNSCPTTLTAKQRKLAVLNPRKYYKQSTLWYKWYFIDLVHDDFMNVICCSKSNRQSRRRNSKGWCWTWFQGSHKSSFVTPVCKSETTLPKNTYCWVYIQFQFNWYLFQSWTVTLKWVIFHQPWCTEYSFNKVCMTHTLLYYLKFQCTLSQPLKRKMHNFSDVGDIERIVSNNCHNLF